MKGDVCKVKGCWRRVICRDGLACGSCKMIRQKTGSYPTVFSSKLTDKQRFYSAVLLPNANGCMLWSKITTKRGYAVIRLRSEDRRRMLAHRYSYELHYGTFDQSLHVCHKCDNRACMAPDHLFLGTNEDNMMDKMSKGRQAKGSSITLGWKTHPSVKLTHKDVLEIRVLLTNGELIKSIAEKFKVERRTISDIKNNRRWTHVKEPNNE